MFTNIFFGSKCSQGSFCIHHTCMYSSKYNMHLYKYNIHTIQHTRRLLSATGGNGGQLQVDGAFLGAVDALERHCIEHNAQQHKDHPQVEEREVQWVHVNELVEQSTAARLSAKAQGGYGETKVCL